MRLVICIPCYNRVESVSKCVAQLNSIKIDQIPLGTVVDVFFSIDHSSLQGKIKEQISDIDWKLGDVNVIERRFRLGLKEHILRCGDIIGGYDGLIMIEDDILFSTALLDFVIFTLNEYSEKDDIGGFSLYSYVVSEYSRMPFYPVGVGLPYYKMQFASSWGQFWTKKQWFDFRRWLDTNDCQFFSDCENEQVCRWPASSWKKHFIRYLEKTNKYFLYPYVSYTSNPGLHGENHNYTYNLYATQIADLFIPQVSCFSLYSQLPCYNSRFELLQFLGAPIERGSGDGALLVESSFDFYRRYPNRSTFYLKVLIQSLVTDARKVFYWLKKRLSK